MANLVDFLTCQAQSQQSIPSNLDHCATVAKVDAATIRACASGSEGRQLMSDSIAATKAAGVRVSCTANVNYQLFCVHNGGWEQCGRCGSDKAQCLLDAVCSVASPRPAVCGADALMA